MVKGDASYGEREKERTRKGCGVPCTFVSAEEVEEEKKGDIGTGTARAVHAQPPGRAHPVCIRALPTRREEPAKSRLTRHCATCLATVVITRYIGVVVYRLMPIDRVLSFEKFSAARMTAGVVRKSDRSDVILAAGGETGWYRIDTSKVQRRNCNRYHEVTTVTV